MEGKTETAFKTALKRFLDRRCEVEGRGLVRLQTREMDSRLLIADKVTAMIMGNLADPEVLGVVALIDVVSSGRPRQFKDAAEAIAFLQRCGPPDDSRYQAHAAQYDFEAWLLPFWADISRKVLGKVRPAPGGNPEEVNHEHPPSQHLARLYREAGRGYDKPRDARAILEGKDLTLSAARCPQLKAFLNTLLRLAGCTLLQ
ncbi:MAG: DUF4276 family protein [Chloroflexota bacterium]